MPTIRLTALLLYDKHYPMNLIGNASKNIADRLVWHTSNRDQEGIAKDLAEGKDIPEVYGLGEAGLFDEFFYFLDHFGFTKLFMKLEPKAIKRNSPVPFMRIIFIYLMRIVAGLRFFGHMDFVILKSQALIRLVGFNGRDIKEGTCNRGGKKKPDSDAKQSVSIRGPVSCDFIKDTLARIAATTLEKMFNCGIKILAENKFFPKNIHALLYASVIESTQKCKGCGKVSKEKPPELRLRNGRIRKVCETVFGFKIWVVWDSNSRLPLIFTTRPAVPKTIIEDDVWVGYSSIIIAGKKIGRRSIVSAGSVVTKDVKSYIIVGGNPAKFIKRRFDSDDDIHLHDLMLNSAPMLGNFALPKETQE